LFPAAVVKVAVIRAVFLSLSFTEVRSMGEIVQVYFCVHFPLVNVIRPRDESLVVTGAVESYHI